MRHAQPRPTTRIENLMSAVIVRSQYADRLTQLLEPACNLFLLLLPRRFARAHIPTGKHVADLAAKLNKLNKIIAPKVLRSIFPARRAPERKILQAALQQVLVT